MDVARRRCSARGYGRYCCLSCDSSDGPLRPLPSKRTSLCLLSADADVVGVEDAVSDWSGGAVLQLKMTTSDGAKIARTRRPGPTTMWIHGDADHHRRNLMTRTTSA